MAMSAIPDNINKAMVLVANYLRGGETTSNVQIDSELRNVILGEWLPMCFPTKGDWEVFADGIADGSIEATSPYKQITHAQPLKIDEQFFLKTLGYTTVKCSQLHEGDLIRLGYNGEDVIALVLAMSKSTTGYYLYFTVRGVLKHSRVYKQVREPFNGQFEGIEDDFKVKLYKKKQIPNGFRGLGNLIMPKPKKSASFNFNTKTAGGRMAKGVVDYLGSETFVGKNVKAVKNFLK